MKESVKELQAKLTPCACGGKVCLDKSDERFMVEEEQFIFWAYCSECHKESIAVTSLEDAVRVWNAGLFEILP